ncbi:hypothetical protein UFOVP149_9 [uncultured Caudovirales phage]|uniref:Uncharacterized protein n=1 Tax=uncultured Caudovirales phage TaxID=2100421 RepID=A0A6J7W6H8_9CAUD|nr:hypothetical protein UFOVP149_9 [uncultured Caudovirales phage]
MNETYVRYLEAKRDELKAQVKLCMDLSYYKDAVIRRLRAQLLLHNIEPE